MTQGSVAKFFPGLYMGWGLGANDSANVFGTAVSTRIISYRRAVILTAIFVILGAWFQGPMVMGLFKKLSSLTSSDAIMAALAAAISMHIMTYWAIPTSSSQAIVGSVIGIGVLRGTASFKPLIKVFGCWVVAPIGSALIAYVFLKAGSYLMKRYVKNIRLFDSIIKWFTIAAGCYGAYSLGANNVGNVTGVYFSSGMLTAQEAALLGGVGIALGALTYSYKVMLTVGTKITTLEPFSAAVSIFSAAVTVHVFCYIGVPVSTSQAAVGAVAGIGLVKGGHAVSTKTLKNCVLGWLATPLSSAIMAVVLVYGMNFIK